VPLLMAGSWFGLGRRYLETSLSSVLWGFSEARLGLDGRRTIALDAVEGLFNALVYS